MPSVAVLCTDVPGSCAQSRRIRCALKAPPPHTSSWLVRGAWRFNACAAARALNSASVAWTSAAGGIAESAIQHGLQPRRVEQIASGALGWQACKEGLCQQASQQGRVHLRPMPPSARVVIGRAQVAQAPGVQQRIARTAVEAEHLALSRQQREVADATEVQHRHVHARHGEQAPRVTPAPAGHPGRRPPRRDCGSRRSRRHGTARPAARRSSTATCSRCRRTPAVGGARSDRALPQRKPGWPASQRRQVARPPLAHTPSPARWLPIRRGAVHRHRGCSNAAGAAADPVQTVRGDGQ